MPTFTKWIALKAIIDQLPEQENEDFRTIAYTIGAMMVFPANRSMANGPSTGSVGATGKSPIDST